jgi:hypothetical protein
MQEHLRQYQETQKDLQKKILKHEHEAMAKDLLIQQQKDELCRLKVDEDTLKDSIRMYADPALNDFQLIL